MATDREMPGYHSKVTVPALVVPGCLQLHDWKLFECEGGDVLSKSVFVADHGRDLDNVLLLPKRPHNQCFEYLVCLATVSVSFGVLTARHLIVTVVKLRDISSNVFCQGEFATWMELFIP